MKKKNLCSLVSLCACAALAGTGAVAFAEEVEEPVTAPDTGITVDGSIVDWEGTDYITFHNDTLPKWDFKSNAPTDFFGSKSENFEWSIAFKVVGEDLYFLSMATEAPRLAGELTTVQVGYGSFYDFMYNANGSSSGTFEKYDRTNPASEIEGKDVPTESILKNWQIEVKLSGVMANDNEETFRCFFLYDQDGYKQDETQHAFATGEFKIENGEIKYPTTYATGDALTTGKIGDDGFVCPVVHEYGEVVEEEPATCTKDGSGTKTCELCGDEQDVVFDALGHDWDEGTVTTEPDCTTPGEKTFTCQREGCDETETEPVNALGHVDVITRNDPTDFEDEGTDGADGYCDRCGSELPKYALREDPMYDWENSGAELIKATEFTTWTGATIPEDFQIDFAMDMEGDTFYVYFNINTGSANKNKFQMRVTYTDDTNQTITVWWTINYKGDGQALDAVIQNPGQAANPDEQFDSPEGYGIETEEGWAGEFKFPIAFLNKTLQKGEDFTLNILLAYLPVVEHGWGTGSMSDGSQYVVDKADADLYEYTFKAEVDNVKLVADKTTAAYTYKSAENIVIGLEGVTATAAEDITVTVGGEALDAGKYTLVLGEDDDAGTAVLTLKKEYLTGKEGFTVVVTDTKNQIEENKTVSIEITVDVPLNYGEAGLANGEEPDKNSTVGDVVVKLDLNGETIATVSYNNKTLVSGTDYTFDAATGTLTIKEAALGSSGNKTIVIETENDASKFTFQVKFNKTPTSTDDKPTPPVEKPEPGDPVYGDEDESLSGGAIAGIVIGSILGAAALAVGGFFLVKYLLKKKTSVGGDAEEGSDGEDGGDGEENGDAEENGDEE